MNLLRNVSEAIFTLRDILKFLLRHWRYGTKSSFCRNFLGMLT